MAFYIGLMSGTSMDAIDVALLDFSNNNCKLIASHSHAFSNGLNQKLQQLIQSETFNLRDFGTLDVDLGKAFADAANQLIQQQQIDKGKISAIGSHGQTVFHSPGSTPPFTLQIGDPNCISQFTGITTVADFRRRDIAAGGQGAPLVPAFHNAFFRSPQHNRVILNIGGIANTTMLAADQNKAISGFDTGPGNCLLDEWCQQHLDQPFDNNGAWAATGIINDKLLQQLLADNYFSLSAPKSTGREYFNLHWLKQHSIDDSPENIQATLTQLSVESIARAIEEYARNCDEVYVCGGGAFNASLMRGLESRLADIKVKTTTELGIDPEWVEAAAFAWLAKQTLENKPGNIAAVTGASANLILGGIYPA